MLSGEAPSNVVVGCDEADVVIAATHLASMGARSISRARFATLLRQLIHSLDPPDGWTTTASGAGAP